MEKTQHKKVLVRDKATKETYVMVKGIEHGLHGYNNLGCRCPACKEANREQSRNYRERKFAGRPLCIIKKCHRVQSRAYGNELCYKHAEALIALREKRKAAARKAAATRRKRKLAMI